MMNVGATRRRKSAPQERARQDRKEPRAPRTRGGARVMVKIDNGQWKLAQ